MRKIILIVFGAALALGMMAACSVPDVPQPNSTAPAQSAHIPADEGDSEPLAFEGTIGAGAVCVQNELCRLDKEQNKLIKLDFLKGTSISLPLNTEIGGFEQVRLSEPLQAYANVYFYGTGDTETRALISLESGELFPLTLEMDAPDDVPNKAIKIFAQADENTFLTAQGLSYSEANLSAGTDVERFMPSMQYTFAMLPVQSCLENKAEFQTIRRIS